MKSVRDPDICADMLVEGAFDHSCAVVDIPFCGEDRILPLFNDDSDMIVLPVCPACPKEGVSEPR